MELSDQIEGLRGQDDVEDYVPRQRETTDALEDMFMKLNEMETFVQEAEKMEENLQSNLTSEEEDLDSMVEEEELFGSKRSKRRLLSTVPALLLRLRSVFIACISLAQVFVIVSQKSN